MMNMKNQKLKKKILLDLRLIVIAILSFIFGILSSPLVENPIFDIDSTLSLIIAAPAIPIILYLIFSWMFYEYFYKSDESKKS